MRRLPTITCVTTVLAAGLLAGVHDSATAARKPSPFASQTISLTPNETQTRCVLTVSWVPSEPERVAGYVVQSDDAPVTARSTVQAKATNDATASWEIDDNAAMYVDITITYVDGRPSKPLSIGYPAWDCLG